MRPRADCTESSDRHACFAWLAAMKGGLDGTEYLQSTEAARVTIRSEETREPIVANRQIGGTQQRSCT